jgi:O-antigen ligase
MKTEKILIYTVIIFFILNLYGDPTIRLLGSVGKYVFVGLFFFTFLWRYLRDELPRGMLKHDRAIFRLLGVLVLFFATSVFISSNEVKAASNMFSFIILLSFLYLLTRHYIIQEEEGAIIKIAEVIVQSIVFSFVLGMVLVLFLDLDMMEVDFTGGRYRRGFGFFLGDRMSFGFLSNLGLFLSIFLHNHFRQYKRRKICYFSLACLFFLCALLSNTRTAFLFIALMFLILMKFQVFDRITWPPRYSIILVSLLVITVLAILLIPAYADQITDRDLINQFSTGRLIIWYLALQLLFEGNPLFGLGFKVTGSVIVDSFIDMSPYFAEVGELSLHSSYIEILSSGGFFGLLTFIVLAGTLYFKIKDPFLKAFTISFLAISMVASLVVIPNIPISSFFWIVLFYTGITPQEGFNGGSTS